MNTEKKTYNTDSGSLDRIYLEKEIDALWVPDYVQYFWVTFQLLNEWLKKAEKKAKKEKFENVHIQCSYRESDCGSVDSQSITVRGYRLETDKEYKDRLKHMLYRIKSDKTTFDSRKLYFDGDPTSDKVSDFMKYSRSLEDKINNIK